MRKKQASSFTLAELVSITPKINIETFLSKNWPIISLQLRV